MKEKISWGAIKFWRSAYMAAIASGKGTTSATETADLAVEDFEKFVKYYEISETIAENI